MRRFFVVRMAGDPIGSENDSGFISADLLYNFYLILPCDFNPAVWDIQHLVRS